MKRQSEFIPEVLEEIGGIHAQLALALERRQGLSRRALHDIAVKFERAAKIITINITKE